MGKSIKLDEATIVQTITRDASGIDQKILMINCKKDTSYKDLQNMIQRMEIKYENKRVKEHDDDKINDIIEKVNSLTMIINNNNDVRIKDRSYKNIMIKCKNCNKIGHISSNCRNKPTINNKYFDLYKLQAIKTAFGGRITGKI